MPFYDFECSECGELFSHQQTFEEHDRHRKPKCPECGSPKVRELVSVPQVHTPKKS